MKFTKIMELPEDPVNCPMKDLIGGLSATLNSRPYYGLSGFVLSDNKRRIAEDSGLRQVLGISRRHKK